MLPEASADAGVHAVPELVRAAMAKRYRESAAERYGIGAERFEQILLAVVARYAADAGVLFVPSKVSSYLCAGRPIVLAAPQQNLAAQSVPRAESDAAMRERKNAWTVGIAGGLLSGSYMRFADEIGSALNDGDNLRILPIVSFGAASNLEDLLYLHGVDAAITQSDVFEYFRTQRKTANLENRVQYVIRLPISELQVLLPLVPYSALAIA